MVKIRVGLCAARLPVLLQVGLRILQVARTSRVTATNRALLEVTFQDVAARERVFAKMTLVWSFTGVYDES